MGRWLHELCACYAGRRAQVWILGTHVDRWAWWHMPVTPAWVGAKDGGSDRFAAGQFSQLTMPQIGWRVREHPMFFSGFYPCAQLYHQHIHAHTHMYTGIIIFQVTLDWLSCRFHLYSANHFLTSLDLTCNLLFPNIWNLFNLLLNLLNPTTLEAAYFVEFELF